MNKEDIAKILIRNKAVTISAENFYTYTSGIKSPIYCDNRLLLGSIDDREKVIKAFLDILGEIDFDIAAGVSTAGIAWAAWISSEMEKPMCYIRGGKKTHGKGKQIEGADVADKKVAVIEDLISTGTSSRQAAESVAGEGGEPVVLASIFNYQFMSAEENFKNAKYSVRSLSDFSALIKIAKETNYIKSEEVAIVKKWHDNPEKGDVIKK